MFMDLIIEDCFKTKISIVSVAGWYRWASPWQHSASFGAYIWSFKMGPKWPLGLFSGIIKTWVARCVVAWLNTHTGAVGRPAGSLPTWNGVLMRLTRVSKMWTLSCRCSRIKERKVCSSAGSDTVLRKRSRYAVVVITSSRVNFTEEQVISQKCRLRDSREESIECVYRLNHGNSMFFFWVYKTANHLLWYWFAKIKANRTLTVLIRLGHFLNNLFWSVSHHFPPLSLFCHR